jgi:AAA15 family ATPase/GTPase
MITKIAMNNVASYKSLTTLETDKTVNLIYGLNGTGKSTLSSFLYNKDDSKFNDCSINSLIDEDIRVYNQKFIQDYFYESGNLQKKQRS